MDFPTARTQISAILDQLEATYDPPPPPPVYEIPMQDLALCVDPRGDCRNASILPCEDGDGVQQLVSADANAYVMQQAVLSEQFIWRASGEGGQPYLEGNNAAKRHLTFPLLAFSQPLTVYVVSGRGRSGNAQCWCGYVGAGGGNYHQLYYRSNGEVIVRVGDTTENATLGQAVPAGPVHIHAIVIDGANTVGQQNGSERLIGWDATAPATTANDLQINAIGAGSFNYHHFDGPLYLLAIYNGIHDLATQADIVAGLGGRFGGVWIPPAGADPTAILPQTHDDDVTQRDWLATLSETDFNVPTAPITYSPSGAAVRDLYGTYQAFGSTGKRQPRNDLLRYPSSAFVLDNAGEGIEGDGTNVRILNAASGDKGLMLEAAEYCQLFGQAGFTNPYYQHAGVANRLCSQAIAAMMQLRYMAEWGFYGAYPEAVGMSCMQAMSAWEAGKDYATGMTPEIRAAFYRTVHAVLKEWDAREGPKTVNTNMDVKTWVALAHLSKGAVGEGLLAIAEDARVWAKRWMLGDESHEVHQSEGWKEHVLFAAAGYVGEKQMPETSYFGISIYYATKAALIVRGVAGWEWLWDTGGVVDRMARFSAYQTYRDPNGSFMGPSGYTIRGGQPTCEWQSSSVGGSYAVAALSDHGIGIFQKRFINPGLELTKLTDPTLAEIESRITSVLASDYSDWSALPPGYNAYTSGAEWQWAYRVSTVAAHCDPTDYDYISGLIATADDKLQLPHLREDYSEIFGPNQHDMPEFWSVEENGHHYFVEGFTRDPTVGTGYGSWRGGGSLQSFGTRDAGTLINTACEKDNSASSGWANVAQWATHHLWFEMDDNTKCSSAQRDSRVSQYEWLTTDCGSGMVEAMATNTPDRETGSYTGAVTYDRKFKRLTNGLRITTTLTTDGQDLITTLWESLPIFIRKDITAYPSTTIEYSTDGATWATLGEAIVVGITHIRLGKDYGSGPKYVYIVPSVPQRMKLGAMWMVNYQVKWWFRQLMSDLHPNSGTSQAIPVASVTYEVRTAA